MEMQISAILSDYDGTLCPTDSIRNQSARTRGKDDSNSCSNSSRNRVPEQLEKTLLKVSKIIPICMISNKDFDSLHEPTRKFTKLLSCVLGIETILHKKHNHMKDDDDLDCVIGHHLSIERQVLTNNAAILKIMAEKVSRYSKDIVIEKKLTFSDGILVGLRFDYRHMQNWKSFKKDVEPSIKAILHDEIDKYIPSSSLSYSWNLKRPFIQSYSSHPFLDVYAVDCNKGYAFDQVVSQLSLSGTFVTGINHSKPNTGENNKILYLGDSENDNPAFKKASVSIGVISDKRPNPKLDCQYSIEFNKLSTFLERLIDQDFIFSENLLTDDNGRARGSLSSF
jgi:hydroxymethylpyrimidine pyrophosphatase-like HAD family hydrolase